MENEPTPTPVAEPTQESGAAVEPTRAPSTEALTQLEAELAELEAELAELEAADGSDS